MKLKRILAGAVAGCMLVGTVIGSSIVGSADTTEVLNKVVENGYEIINISDYTDSDLAEGDVTVKYTFVPDSQESTVLAFNVAIVLPGYEETANPETVDSFKKIGQNNGGQVDAKKTQYGKEYSEEHDLYKMLNAKATEAGVTAADIDALMIYNVDNIKDSKLKVEIITADDESSVADSSSEATEDSSSETPEESSSETTDDTSSETPEDSSSEVT